ncbi:Lrp/AsnC family transcriptional regulator [Pedobacter africanus]|uniref:DNA-binding Lrp family transcriptional regulator n=2 Tax=Pedobacter africanus TaxID=151894 RepID=A0ACC6KZ76_9SPHI|nr:Lrp/AsnC family transcriptional regulator [Pedobacter africanus]MDR6784678.1 DNA-binding Lrp family transcriptional regulator [Pedobacter africanus]SMC51465.1 DNA-binding transcriptional regulator, Lrp family [Pedobacter africanus]
MATGLDEVDIKILQILQKDAAQSNEAVAGKVNKSIATTHARIRRLKENGYIKRVVAVLDNRKIERSHIAFSQVLLKSHTKECLKEFKEEVAKFEEVMECFQMTGAFDFILRIATRDMDDYNLFYNEKLATLSSISTIQTSFVMSEIKSDTAYPL